MKNLRLPAHDFPGIFVSLLVLFLTACLAWTTHSGRTLQWETHAAHDDGSGGSGGSGGGGNPPPQPPQATATPVPICGGNCGVNGSCGIAAGPCAGGTCTIDDLDYNQEGTNLYLRMKQGTSLWRYVRNVPAARWDFVNTNNFTAAPFNRTTGVDEMDYNMEPVNGVMTNILRLRKDSTIYAYRAVSGVLQLTNTTNLAATAPFTAAGGVCAGGTCHIHEFDISTEQGGRRVMRFREGNIIWVYEYVGGAWVFLQNSNLATTAPFNAAGGICPNQTCTINNFDFNEENGILYARFRTNTIIRTYRYTKGARPVWSLINTSPALTTLAQINSAGSGLVCEAGKCKISACAGKTCTCSVPTPSIAPSGTPVVTPQATPSPSALPGTPTVTPNGTITPTPEGPSPTQDPNISPTPTPQNDGSTPTPSLTGPTPGEETGTPPPLPTPTACVLPPLDVMLVFDHTPGISPEAFAQAKAFAATLTERLMTEETTKSQEEEQGTQSVSSIRVGVVAYGDTPKNTHTYAKLTNDRAAVLTAIEKIRRAHSGPCIHCGIRRANWRTVGASDTFSEDSTKITILFSDGDTSYGADHRGKMNQQQAMEQAMRAVRSGKRRGSHIFAIGMGQQPRADDLRMIASDPNDVFYVPFAEANALLEKIPEATSLCKSPLLPEQSLVEALSPGSFGAAIQTIITSVTQPLRNLLP